MGFLVLYYRSRVHGIPRRRYGESGEVSAMVSGMKYYAHDPIDIEDLNGKRRRGERIDKPSGTNISSKGS